MLRTSHATEADLARALAQELRQRGVTFPAVFPYNRYDHENTSWWLSMKGSPAFAAAKICVRRNKEQRLEVGLVVEKGFEVPDPTLVKAPHRLTSDWDWQTVTTKMRGRAFAEILANLVPLGLRVWLDAHPLSVPGQKDRGRSDHLVFWPLPWSRQLYASDSPASRPLLSVADANSMPALLDAMDANPQRVFCWYDLYVTAPLEPAVNDDDPIRLVERVVDELLLPLIRWTWPVLSPSESR